MHAVKVCLCGVEDTKVFQRIKSKLFGVAQLPMAKNNYAYIFAVEGFCFLRTCVTLAKSYCSTLIPESKNIRKETICFHKLKLLSQIPHTPTRIQQLQQKDKKTISSAHTDETS